MAPTTSATPPPPPPPGVPVKKKTNPLVWILVGCLGLVVVSGVIFVGLGFFAARKLKDVVEDVAENPVKAAAELAVKMNPDLELVSSDDDAQTMTIRDKNTGEESTFNWSDIQNGRMTFESDGKTMSVDTNADGSMTVQDESGEQSMTFGGNAGAVPSWFPAYHNQTDVNVLVNANQNGQQSTIWTFQSGDAVAAIMGFYEQELKNSGWEVSTNTSEMGGTSNGSIEAKQEGGAKILNLVVSKNGSEPANAMATYTETGG